MRSHEFPMRNKEHPSKFPILEMHNLRSGCFSYPGETSPMYEPCDLRVPMLYPKYFALGQRVRMLPQIWTWNPVSGFRQPASMRRSFELDASGLERGKQAWWRLRFVFKGIITQLKRISNSEKLGEGVIEG